MTFLWAYAEKCIGYIHITLTCMHFKITCKIYDHSLWYKISVPCGEVFSITDRAVLAFFFLCVSFKYMHLFVVSTDSLILLHNTISCCWCSQSEKCLIKKRITVSALSVQLKYQHTRERTVTHTELSRSFKNTKFLWCYLLLQLFFFRQKSNTLYI